MSNSFCGRIRCEAADQIDRLRLWAEDEQQKREKVEEQRMEARSEIERLQAEVVKWQIEAGKFAAGCPCCDDIGEENERLRAALIVIRDEGVEYGGACCAAHATVALKDASR